MLTLGLIAPGDLALNRSADMLVLLSWEQSTQHLRHPGGTAI
jgi:hypothetical protein